MESANKGDFYYLINPCTDIDLNSCPRDMDNGLIQFYIDENCRSILGQWSKYLVDGDLNLVLVST